MTSSTQPDEAPRTKGARPSKDAPQPKPARPGKRERLVAAASDLVYRQGVAPTTLAGIAQVADVPLGNVYYYFKTKEDIVAAVVRSHEEQLNAALAELAARHRSPKARLRAFVGMLSERAEEAARYGCPYGSLSTELAKRAEGSDPLAAPLMQIQLDWAEQQFHAMGRRDARDLAVELVSSYQGSAVVTSTLGQPEVMVRQARRLQRWIDSLTD
ncbi:TetR/AcrR family transcriptional regulator [Kribbella deserti]|uniref:TetR/AcrR family transcriptional regulator n=1 Tax=Kribbella deserti TaxID=1926257 RepID=A0ABV6QW38_9ACTN